MTDREGSPFVVCKTNDMEWCLTVSPTSSTVTGNRHIVKTIHYSSMTVNIKSTMKKFGCRSRTRFCRKAVNATATMVATASVAFSLTLSSPSTSCCIVSAFSSPSTVLQQSPYLATTTTPLHMQQAPHHRDHHDDVHYGRKTPISSRRKDLAATSDAKAVPMSNPVDFSPSSLWDNIDPSFPSSKSIESFIRNFVLPVGSASLMITGNTVGAGMLVLPELSSGPGMTISTGIFCIAWFMNLVSGLTIAQVAIRQHESSGDEVPSSFKEFAESTMGIGAANAVSGISVFINILVLAFDVFKAGQVGDSLLESTGLVGHIDLPIFFSIMWVTVLGGVVASQRLETLSKVASILVICLFVTFAGLLLPGLAHVSDPMAVFTAAPTLDGGTEIVEGIFRMVPVVITTLVFQNIVPSITRLLDYDRAKITSALIAGSIIPLFMYLSWCTTMLGGGIVDDGIISGGLLLSAFSLITVGGSSLGSLVSLSEEVTIALNLEKKETFSIPSVALPIVGALVIGEVFSSDITSLLKIAGSFGSPLLYGAIPVVMAATQLQESSTSEPVKDTDAIQSKILPTRISFLKPAIDVDENAPPSVVPGGALGLALLGLGSTALVGSELLETFNQYPVVV